MKGGLWDHLVVCLRNRLCLSISLCIHLNSWGLWFHIAVCLCPPKFSRFLCHACRIKGKRAINFSQNFLLIIYFLSHTPWNPVCGSVVGWGTTLQAGRSRDRIPDEVDFFNLPYPSSRTMALGSTQPLREMSTRNLPGGEGRPARKADNLTAICEPIVYKNMGASTSHSPMGLHGPLQGYLYLYPLKSFRVLHCG
jgi:hypothetical protein